MDPPNNNVIVYFEPFASKRHKVLHVVRGTIKTAMTEVLQLQRCEIKALSNIQRGENFKDIKLQ